jgi:hypothetical protein
MSDHTDRDEHERGLAALFDDTADVPSAAALTRSRARAAEIPGRVRRRRNALWLGLPAFAGVLALMVMLGRHSAPESSPFARAPATSDGVARESTPAALPLAPPSAVTAASEPPESEPASDDVDDLGFDLDDAAPADSVLAASALGSDFGADEFEALYEPPPDADLDAWLRATDDLLQGGG